MIIRTNFPYEFHPYEHQKVAWRKYFKEGVRRFIDIEHRRAGKDISWWTMMIAMAQYRVGLYLHTLPTFSNAKRVIWNGIDENGKRYIDYIPKHLIDGSPNSSEMRVTLKNGSIIQLMGADNYDSFRGLNPLHINFSEAAQQSPRTWDITRPILTKNGGSATFISTPYGQNHFYKLYRQNYDNASWFCRILTVKDTYDHEGKPLISQEAVDEDRRSGMSENMIDQEYYCSFLSCVPGAYFTRQMKAAYDGNRIYDFPIDTSLAVHTYWDLGLDATSVWFVQFLNNEIRLIAHYENTNTEISHFVNYLHDFRDRNMITYGEHYAPHDGDNRRVETGKSMKHMVFDLGLRFKIVPKINNKLNAIEYARLIFSRCIFHKTNCEYGLSCLQEYHAEFNEKTLNYTSPVHDWSSHAADAFMQLAQFCCLATKDKSLGMHLIEKKRMF